ncbi:MAG: phospho-N-acetylmuramoyl-pentapeptide-transferase [Firmicutes bacterium]|nr:phospho-N-acetylmuramoyl-pentapeptide-transferase [Bacillota bacterium]
MNVKNVLVLLIAYALSALLTGLLIPWLKKLKFGQNIREDGPQAHLAKQGTPTMGGIAMLLAGTACFLGWLIATKEWNVSALIIALGFIGFGVVGFLDDFLKIKKKQNEGLTVRQKFALEILLGVAIAALRVLGTSYGSTFWIPFWHTRADFGWFAYPFIVFIVVAMTNAVNLTDGLDGLASSVTAVVAAFVAAIAGGFVGSQTGGIFSLIVLGITLGFLLYNHHPAKVFMGDTGSLALGGALAAIGLVSGTELLLPLAGLIYVAEALSVMLQVGYFKMTHGKRLFRMAPLHHHFELGGWKETKVVWVFTAATAVFCLIALLGVIL